MELSIITPVGIGTDLDYLEQAYKGISMLDVDWQWLIQFDGARPDFDLAGRDFLDNKRIKYLYNGERLGVALTRNNALMRSEKKYCLALDSDDLIIPEGIYKILSEIQSLENVDYVIGECLDLFPSGQRVRRFKDRKLQVGYLEKWSLLALWVMEGSLYFQPGPVLYRSQALKEIGGWARLPSIKDFEIISTLLHVEGRGRGYYSAHDIYLYRQHAGQNTRNKKEDETALETIKHILSKAPDSPQAQELLQRMKAGDRSMVSISGFFSDEWHKENSKLSQS